MIRRSLAAIALILLCAVGARADGAQQGQMVLTLASQGSGPAVALGRVERKRPHAMINVTATIEPDANHVAHVSSRIMARVVKLLVQPGAQVAAGEPLVVLNSVDLGKAKTEYLKAASLESIAAQHLKRERQLYAQKIAAQKDMLQAEAAHDSALAELKASRETLILLIGPDEVRHLSWSGNGHPLSEFTLASPIAGTLVKRDLTVGSLIGSDSDPIVVIDLDNVWVIANLFERDLEGIAVGSPARVTVEAYAGQSFEGVVRYIADTVDRATRTIKARIEVHNPGHRLKPGMFARASLVTSADGPEVLIVPEAAIYQVGARKVAFVAEAPGRFEVREVELGQAEDGGFEVVAGLREGDQVVTQGGVRLKAMLLNGVAGSRKQ